MTRTTALITSLAAAAACTATPALALDGGAYVNLGAEVLDYTPAEFSVDSAQGVFAVGRAGYDFGRFFGVEAEGGFGSVEEDVTFPSGISLGTGPEVTRTDITNTVEATSRWGLAARGRVPVTDSAEVFVRLGGGQLATERSRIERITATGEVIDNFQGSRNVDAVMAGIGAQVMFGAERRNGVRVDLTGWAELDFGDEDDSAADYTTITLAYVRKF